MKKSNCVKLTPDKPKDNKDGKHLWSINVHAVEVPQKFISILSVQSDRSPLLTLTHFLLHLPSSTPPSTQTGCSSDTEHKLKRTACLCDEWISGGEKRGVDGEVEEEKVTVFPESKPPLFDHRENWCWSSRCVLSLASHGWLAGWTWWGFIVCGAGGGGHARCYTS